MAHLSGFDVGVAHVGISLGELGIAAHDNYARSSCAFPQKDAVVLFVDRLVDQFLIDQESMKLARYDFVSQRREVDVEELI